MTRQAFTEGPAILRAVFAGGVTWNDVLDVLTSSSTRAFQVQWSQTDPEEIVSLSWNGSPNLTNSWTHPFCPQGGDRSCDLSGAEMITPRRSRS
jgi:hypothetical protein